VTVRGALATDADDIARLLVAASGGLVDYVFAYAAPDHDPVAVMTRAVADILSLYSYRNCFVAVEEKTIVATVNAFPAEAYRLDPTVADALPPAVLERLRPIYETTVPGSLYLSGMGVAAGHRGHGHGGELMAALFAEARRLGREEVSLLVWGDNVNAVRFYAAMGFTRRRKIAVDLGPGHRHEEGMLLMVAPTPA